MKIPVNTGVFAGAGGGTRTLTHSRAADFESAASAISPLRQNGAGEGNRTLVASLEGWSSAIELRPLNKKPSLFGMVHCLPFLTQWRGRRGSNPQPPDRQSSALTNCATTPLLRKVMCSIAYFPAPAQGGVFDFSLRVGCDCLVMFGAGLPSSVRLASQHLRSPTSRQLTYFARDTSTALA